jgi:hypothetical protein
MHQPDNFVNCNSGDMIYIENTTISFLCNKMVEIKLNSVLIVQSGDKLNFQNYAPRMYFNLGDFPHG